MLRKIAFGGLMLLAVSAASAQAPRPPVGGIGSPPDAMIFYVAHGAADACGPGCSDWIAAEGTVQWDTHKRLFNILDRHPGRKLPVIIHVWGESNLNIATTLAVSCASAASTPRSARPRSRPAAASRRRSALRSSVRADRSTPASSRQTRPATSPAS